MIWYPSDTIWWLKPTPLLPPPRYTIALFFSKSLSEVGKGQVRQDCEYEKWLIFLMEKKTRLFQLESSQDLRRKQNNSAPTKLPAWTHKIWFYFPHTEWWLCHNHPPPITILKVKCSTKERTQRLDSQVYENMSNFPSPCELKYKLIQGRDTSEGT